MFQKLKVLEKMLCDISEYRGAKSVSKISSNIKYANSGGRITIPGDTHSTYEYIPFSEYSGEGGYFEVITSEAPQDVGLKFYPNEIQFNRIITKGVGQGVSLARRDVVRTGFKTRPPQITNDMIVSSPEPTSEPEVIESTTTETGSQEDFIEGVLRGIGAPVTDDNVEFLSTWSIVEGGRAENNLFNLTMRLPGSTPLDPNNRNGIQNYPTQEIGIQAMVKTMVLARNHVLVSALKSGRTSTDIASIPQVQSAISNWSGSSDNGIELYNKLAQSNGVNTTQRAEVPQESSGGAPSGLDSAGEDFLKRKEGKELKAYPDPRGQNRNFSIGYGFSYFPDGFRGQRKRKVVRTDEITEIELEELFDMVTSEFENAVTSSVTSSINQNQYNALVALAYNIGIAAFKESRLLRMVNQNPNDPEIKTEFETETKGYPINSDTYRGLLRRRREEANLYFSR